MKKVEQFFEIHCSIKNYGSISSDEEDGVGFNTKLGIASSD